ncbi:MAG: cytochrome c3 family protein [Desulfohalobiaceae bacterium]
MSKRFFFPKALKLAVVMLFACLVFGPAKTLASSNSGHKPPDWQAPEQEEARQRAKEVPEFVKEVKEEDPVRRSMRIRELDLRPEDIKHAYFLLDSPIIKQTKDKYEPVRFMHSKHASLVQDCASCHHYRPQDPEASETEPCSACHQESFRLEAGDRPGLSAAYHQRCMGCHEQENAGPVGCEGCHRKNVPDHSELVELDPDPEPSEVTQECLSCHEQAGQDMLQTSHWLWKGHSSYTADHGREVDLGKATTVTNNF